MGSDATAILFYGICLDECLELPWETDDDTDDSAYYASKMGINEPGVEYSEETKGEFVKYWEKREEVNKKSKCEVILHCSGDEAMYVMALSDSTQKADWGEPLELQKLESQPEWDGLLKDYCEKMDIEYIDPKWFLVARWF